MAYWPLRDEVDTRPLIRSCYEAGVHVVLPVVEEDELVLRLYEGEERMRPGAFGILEPQGEPFTAYEKIGRIYVPGMAFTQDGKRLGRGRGYYDRFLMHLHEHAASPTPEIIGVCAPGHLLADIPCEKHDWRMHRVILPLFLIMLWLCTFSACQKKPTAMADNPVFNTAMDTTGADDPYIYEDDTLNVSEEEQIRHVQNSWRLRQEKHREVKAPYLNKEKGIISQYDNLFHNAAARTGWDWRLIAAQCYQESGFDPQARSGAGARGLMQIMPATAKSLGLPMEKIHDPVANIEASARLIKKLSSQFADIRDPEERIHFVLASYNGGPGHIRDAMALTKKYGGNPNRWADVSKYVLGLQEARFYRDPVVKCGYMIGSETTNYVTMVVQRARQYGANMAIVHLPSGWKPFSINENATEDNNQEDPTVRPTPSTNRFTQHNASVMTPEEMEGMQ